MHVIRLSAFFAVCMTATALNPKFDVDVAVPPGTPLEWLRQTRQPTPTGLGRIPVPIRKPAPRPGDKPGGPRETTDGRPLPEPESDGPGSTMTEDGLDIVSTDAFAYARIASRDIAGHLNWVIPVATETNNGVHTQGGVDAAWVYPPKPSEILHWYVLAVYLRKMLHPALVSEAECIQFLTELGEPSLYGAEAAAGESTLADMAKMVWGRVSGFSASYPTVKSSNNVSEAMLYRLAAQELTNGFVHELNPYFACRLLGLGRQVFPVLAEYARASHTFLARNATSVLGNSTDPKACDVLLELARATRDPVIRARAVSGLIRRRHLPAVDLLCTFAKGPDKPLMVQALYGLGMIGDKKATTPVLQVAKAAGNDPDILWAAIPALGRLQDPRPEVLAFLKAAANQLEADLRDAKPTPRDHSRWGGDPPGTRIRVLLQMTLAALTCLKDPDGRKAFFTMLNTTPDLPPGRSRMQEASTLKNVETPAQLLALEALAASADEGREWLGKILDNAQEDPSIHITAINLWSGDMDRLRLLAKTSTTPVFMRAQAIRILSRVGPDAVEECCRAILKEGVTAPEFSHLVAIAMRALGKHGRNTPEELIRIIDKELLYREPPPPKPRDPKARYYSPAPVIIRAAVLETAVYELGRTGRSEGVPKLLEVLRTKDLDRGRAEAALSLAAVEKADVVDALVESLEDKVGWVRFCAARALASVTTRDVECDWIYGSDSKRREAIEAWNRIVK